MPKTKVVNDFLIREMRRRGHYDQMWIGMHDRVEEGTWVWEDGSDVVDWGNMDYFNGGLFGDGSDCMALDSQDGQWHDNRCFTWVFDKRKYYICQYQREADVYTVDSSAIRNKSDGAKRQGGDLSKMKLTGLQNKDADDNKQHKDLFNDVTGPANINNDDKGPVDTDDDDKGPVDTDDDDKGPIDTDDDDKGPVDTDDNDKGPVDTDDNDKGPVDTDDDDKGPVDTDDDVTRPLDDDVNEPINIDDDAIDLGQANLVHDDGCPPFNCPDLDCGMGGYRMQNGCQTCQCNE
ncbi:eukaryotic translation initiation factor 3 subunit A [Elysia marginata]|uniref:Eukaryotic translation initiation factor 3 subunit A n=1 Tax=Elysia marginata TaxID=1093978 RepID=A0AAV4IL63_9GAST|nr:eukaryotic translation initiation factor 3 subunit A [Elysia marginata]